MPGRRDHRLLTATLAQLLGRAAAQSPEHVAVRADGGDGLTYAAWERRSDALAGGLRHHGVRPGVATVLRFDTARLADYAVACLAVHKAGGVAVPTGPGLTDHELARIVDDCGAELILSPPALAPTGGPVPVADPAALEQQARGRPAEPAPETARPAEILYRSRPLTRPVALERSADQLTAGPAASFDPLPAAGRWLHTFPVGTPAAQDTLAAALAHFPLTAVAVPGPDPRRLWELITGGPPQVLGMHPAVARTLLDAGAPTGRDSSATTGLVLAGDRVPEDLLNELRAAFPAAQLLIVDPPGGSRAQPVRGVTPDVAGPAPVAPSQEGMLWHERFAPGCQNLPGLARRFHGPLDADALRRALEEILRRHDPLRTTFEVRAGRPVQLVSSHDELQLDVRDLSDMPVDDREAQVERLVARAGRRPFDLTTERLFQPLLVRLAEDDHVLVIRTHHTVFDDWSVGVFRRELAALYAAFTAGRPSPLDEPDVAFGAFAREQRRRLEGPAGERELAFWRRELEGAPWTTQLPVDDPRLPQGSPQPTGQPTTMTLPADLAARLRSLAGDARATVFMTMMAAFGVLTARYTGQDDLLLATVVANRNRTELEGLIGCFTKKVPLRLQLAGDPTFEEALLRTRRALLGALSHQDLAFETVMQDVLGAGAATHGLVPHAPIVFQGVTPDQELSLPGLESSGFETSTRLARSHFAAADTQQAAAEERTAQPPWGGGLYLGSFVILSVQDRDDGLSCLARGAFHRPAVEDLLATYRGLLASIVADPDRPISELATHQPTPARPAAAPGPQPPEDDTLAGPLAALVAGPADAVAVHAPSGNLTFAQLDAAVGELAGRLRERGAGPDGAVGIATGPRTGAVVAALAAWRLGAAWVGLDPADTGQRLGRIVAEVPVAAVVGTGLPEALADTVAVLPARAEHPGGRAPVDKPAEAGPDTPAVVFHGAGPTAVDPAVVLDQEAVLQLVTRLRHVGYGRPDGLLRRICLSASPTGDGFLRQLVGLLDGHALQVPERRPADDPEVLVQLLGSGDVDLIDCRPGELGALLAAGLQHAAAGRDPDRPDPVLTVGTRRGITPELWRSLQGLDRIEGHLVYGPPACAFTATARRADDDSARAHVGRPLPGIVCRVLDGHGRPVPTRAVGELALSGPALGRTATTDTTGARPPGTGAGEAGGEAHRTGRLARALPGGAVELLGPRDADRDLRGFRVDPGRIAAVLADDAGLHGVLVTLPRDEDGSPHLVAGLDTDGPAPGLAELRTLLWSRVPGYAWPSRLTTPSPGPATAPDVTERDTGDNRQGTDDVPTPPAAGVLGAAWAEVLDLDRVAPDANYWQAFSFLEALGRAREAGVEVAGEHVTRNRTLATLSVAIAAAGTR